VWLTGYVISTICAKQLAPIYEADRHAKKELKKHIRGVRAIERSIVDNGGQVPETIRDYCLAVRSALTADGRPPLDASGLILHERLTLIEQSLERVAKKGDCPPLSSS